MQYAERPTWTSWVWPAATGGLVVLLVVTFGLPALNSVWTTALLAGVVVIAVGLVVWAFVKARQQRRVFEERIETWASQKAAQDERLRIARDLHDLASHGLGLMTVRAATANLDDNDAERRAALTDIERLGRDAIGELRRMLTVLRGTHSAPAPLRPAETISDLRNIAESVRGAGLAVTLDLADLGEVAAGVQLTACAIVRESLGNTLRHAGPSDATVQLTRSGETVTVEVLDSGPQGTWRPHPGAGHGLAGLRERVALHHGTLTTGTHGEGFRVFAEIPASGGAR